MPVVDSHNYRVKLAVFLSVIPGFAVQAVCIGFVSGKVTLKLVFLHCLPFRQPFIILSIYSSQPLKCEKVLIESVLHSPPFKPKKRQDLLTHFCKGIIAQKVIHTNFNLHLVLLLCCVAHIKEQNYRIIRFFAVLYIITDN